MHLYIILEILFLYLHTCKCESVPTTLVCRLAGTVFRSWYHFGVRGAHGTVIAIASITVCVPIASFFLSIPSLHSICAISSRKWSSALFGGRIEAEAMNARSICVTCLATLSSPFRPCFPPTSVSVLDCNISK